MVALPGSDALKAGGGDVAAEQEETDPTCSSCCWDWNPEEKLVQRQLCPGVLAAGLNGFR